MRASSGPTPPSKRAGYREKYPTPKRGLGAFTSRNAVPTSASPSTYRNDLLARQPRVATKPRRQTPQNKISTNLSGCEIQETIHPPACIPDGPGSSLQRPQSPMSIVISCATAFPTPQGTSIHSRGFGYTGQPEDVTFATNMGTAIKLTIAA